MTTTAHPTTAATASHNTGARPLTHTLGYPRIGEKRELKKATEAYWGGKLSRAELEKVGAELRRANWETQRAAGIDLIPSNDFTFYDQVLDTTCLVGNVPPRFGWAGGQVDLDTRFAIARGVRNGGNNNGTAAGSKDTCTCSKEGDASAATQAADTFASEMTKWFDTNYHYIVPEFRADTRFALSATKIFDEFSEALALGIRTKPVILGPVSYLKLGKVQDSQNPDFDRLSLLDALLPVYTQILQKLETLGAEWVQLDEPIGALDLDNAERRALTTAYAALAAAAPKLKLLVTTYFGALRENLDTYLALPIAALHLDATPRGDLGEIERALSELPADKALSLGLVDGRNIWKSDLAALLPRAQAAADKLGAGRLLLAPSCSLQHVPVTLRNEQKFDAEFKGWLAYAEEKLGEVSTLAAALEAGILGRSTDAAASGNRSQALEAVLAANAAAAKSRRESPRIHRPEVKARAAAVTPSDFDRASPYPTRRVAQRGANGPLAALPDFPTTTIGSFPQTPEIRAARLKHKRGELSTAEYEKFIEAETIACVRFQEEVGIDMLVHGEYERNDMVEYFGEQLDGFAFTEHGWVQSYGSRYVKPPIIFGDVSRPAAMTVRWSSYAQSLTKLPMKGMLTGPVTVLQWSFVRDDQPRRDTTFEIALALRDEVLDLEAAGIAAIQIDEPAIREGLPLRRSDWADYLDWAVNAFRLSAAGVRDDTQIHTHMCYSEFNDIIGDIAAMDADVITIETSRSNMELLGAFVNFKYPNEIGPGVYDIHSPRIPTVEEMVNLLRKAAQVIPPENLWVNPDCGLKTRGWAEVRPALANMVEAARIIRKEQA